MPSRWKVLSLILSVVVTLSVGLNMLQAKRILELQEGPASPLTAALHAGSHPPELRAKDLLGHDFVLSFRPALPKPVVLYVFSPSCVWCQRNSENINSLVAQVGNKYQFIGLSLSNNGVVEFLKRHENTFSAYQEIAPESITAYGLESTPRTIVLSADGAVLANWPGAYTGATKAQVETFFGVRLDNNGS